MEISKNVFLEIIHHPDNEDSSFKLDVRERPVTVGDTLQIVDRNFVLGKLRDENGQIVVGKSKSIKENLVAYEELVRTGIMPSGLVHELFLKETSLGVVLLQLQIPAGVYRNAHNRNKTLTEPRNIFLKLDPQMLNTRLRDRSETFDETKIYFTPCMFGSDSAFLISESGRRFPITDRNLNIDEPIVSMQCNVNFNLYEREIISRLVSVVNGLTFSGKINSITTILPHGAYYSFLMEAAAKGFVTPTIVLEWFAMVDEKVHRIQELIKKSIRYFNPKIDLDQYSTMDSACGIMKAYFMEREANPNLPVNLDELLELTLGVVEAADSFVRQAFNSGVPRPTSFREFADLTYGLSVLRDMEIKEDQKGPLPRKQIIGVYDISESRAWYVSKKYRNQNILLHRGQFNNHRAQSTTYDNLSYICVQPIETISMKLEPSYVEKYMDGTATLYNLQTHSLNEASKRRLIRSTRI